MAGLAFYTSNPWSMFTVQQCLNVAAAAATSWPAPAVPEASPARSGSAEGAEGSPQPLFAAGFVLADPPPLTLLSL